MTDKLNLIVICLTFASVLINTSFTLESSQPPSSSSSDQTSTDDNEILPKGTSNFRKAKSVAINDDNNAESELSATEELKVNPDSVYVIRDTSQTGRQDLFGPFFAPLNFLLPPRTNENTNSNNANEAEKSDSTAAIPAQGPAGALGNLLPQLPSFELPSLASFLGTGSGATAESADKTSTTGQQSGSASDASKTQNKNPGNGSKEPVAVSSNVSQAPSDKLETQSGSANKNEGSSSLSQNANSENTGASNNNRPATSEALKRPESESSNNEKQNEKFIKPVTVLASLGKPFASVFKPFGINVEFSVAKGNITTPPNEPPTTEKPPPPGQGVCEHICGPLRLPAILGGANKADCTCTCKIPELFIEGPHPLCEGSSCHNNKPTSACQHYCDYHFSGMPYPNAKCVSGICHCRCPPC